MSHRRAIGGHKRDVHPQIKLEREKEGLTRVSSLSYALNLHIYSIYLLFIRVSSITALMVG